MSIPPSPHRPAAQALARFQFGSGQTSLRAAAAELWAAQPAPSAGRAVGALAELLAPQQSALSIVPRLSVAPKQARRQAVRPATARLSQPQSAAVAQRPAATTGLPDSSVLAA